MTDESDRSADEYLSDIPEEPTPEEKVVGPSVISQMMSSDDSNSEVDKTTLNAQSSAETLEYKKSEIVTSTTRDDTDKTSDNDVTLDANSDTKSAEEEVMTTTTTSPVQEKKHEALPLAESVGETNDHKPSRINPFFSVAPTADSDNSAVDNKFDKVENFVDAATSNPAHFDNINLDSELSHQENDNSDNREKISDQEPVGDPSNLTIKFEHDKNASDENTSVKVKFLTEYSENTSNEEINQSKSNKTADSMWKRLKDSDNQSKPPDLTQEWAVKVFAQILPDMLRQRLASSGGLEKHRNYSVFMESNKSTLKTRLPEPIFDSYFDKANQQTIELARLPIRQLTFLIGSLIDLKKYFSDAEIHSLKFLVSECLPDLYALILGDLPKSLESPTELYREMWKMMSSLEYAIGKTEDVDQIDNDQRSALVENMISDLKNDQMFQTEYVEKIIKTLKSKSAKIPERLKKLYKELFACFTTGPQFILSTKDLLKTEMQRICSCPGCNELIKALHSMPCYHSFCLNCLETGYNSQIDLLTCMKCSASVKLSGKPDIQRHLPINFISSAYIYCLRQVMANQLSCDFCILPATTLCIDCPKMICDNHSAPYFHNLGSHISLKLDRIVLEPVYVKRLTHQYCPLHREKPVSFCRNCKEPICSNAACQVRHADHGRILLLADAKEAKLHSINHMQSLARRKLEKFEVRINAFMKNQTDIEELQENIEDSIHRYFNEIQASLSEKREMFLADLHKVSADCKLKNDSAVDSLNTWAIKTRNTLAEFGCLEVSGPNQDVFSIEGLANYPICEMTVAENALNRAILDTCNGAGVQDTKTLSYPETSLRECHSKIMSMRPSFTLMSMGSKWEIVLKPQGILVSFALKNRYLYLIKRTMLSAYYVCCYELSQIGLDGYQPIILAEGGLQGLESIAVSQDGGTIFITEQSHSTLELTTLKLTKGARLITYSAITRTRTGAQPIPNLNNLANQVIVKTPSNGGGWIAGPSGATSDKINSSSGGNWGNAVFISDGTCICEFNDGQRLDQLSRKFNFHSMVDIADFLPAVADQMDVMLVTDKVKHKLMIFNSKSHIVNTIGSEGATPGCFLRPTGLARDLFGHIAVADTGNGRIQIFNMAGQFLRLIPFPEPLKQAVQTVAGSRSIIQFQGDHLYLGDTRHDTIYRINYMK